MIPNGVNDVQSGGEFSIKVLAEWIIKTLRINVEIPDLNFDDTGNIDNGRFWTELERQTVCDLHNVALLR